MEDLHLKYYNKNLKENARKLRKNSTLSEVVLWDKVLKASQLEGYKFNRQKPLLHYIVDFYCKELKLIIEVDGSSHDSDDALLDDLLRQNELESIGFKIIRFTGYDVLHNIDGVRKKIIEEINKLEPPPNPLREGE
jgi:very-short-patch-repair endonuclease